MLLSGPPRGVAFTTYLSLTQQADTKLYQVDPTLAVGDVKVKKGTGAPANIGTLPSVDAAGQSELKIDLTATEMDAEIVMVKFSDAAGAEWCDVELVIHTSPVPGSTVDDATVTPTQTTFGSDLTGYADDELIDAFVLFISGSNAGTSRKIIDYASTNGQFTFDTNAWENTPADGDKFVVIGNRA